MFSLPLIARFDTRLSALFFHPVDPASLWYSDATRPAFDELHFATDDDQLQLQVNGDLGGLVAYQEVAVSVNGGVWATYPIANGQQVVSIPLVAGITKHVRVREGTQAWGLTGAKVREIVCQGLTWEAEPAHADVMVVVGDSVCAGFLCAHTATEGWTQLLKDDGAYAVTCRASGGYMIAQLPTITGLTFNGTASNVLWLNLGINDFLAQAPLAALQTIYENFLDSVHASHPTVLIYAVSPTVLANEVGATYNMPALRAMIRTVTLTRDWVRYIDGTTLVDLGDLVDGIHPGTAGNTKYFAKVLDILGLAVERELAAQTVKYWHKPDAGRTVAAGKLTAWADAVANHNLSLGSASQGADVVAANHAPAVQLNGSQFYSQFNLVTASTSHTFCLLIDQGPAPAGTYQHAGAGIGVFPATCANGNLGMYHPGVAWEDSGVPAQSGMQVLAFVVSGGTRTWYRNGVQVAQIVGQPVLTVTEAFALGSADGGGGICVKGTVVARAYCDSANVNLVTKFTSWAKARVNL